MNLQINATYVEGLLLGVGLFSALGPKDSFVIRQSLGGGPVWLVVLVCILADFILIALGVAGVGGLLGRSPEAMSLVLLSGAFYLLWFGAQRLRASVCDESMPSAHEMGASSRGQLLRAALILGFANPYAWLDTVVLIGSMGGAKPAGQQAAFAAGTMTASLVWFVALAFASGRLARLFRSRRTWRLLDVAVALLMFYLASQIGGDLIQAR